MNFFNIGTPELILIFIVALIVVGPRRLPEIGREIGKILSDLRRMSQEFTTDLTRELEAPAKEITEMTRELEVSAKELKEIAVQDVSEKPAQGDQA